MRRLTEWWNRGDDFRARGSAGQPAGAGGAAPDFLAQTETPDRPRVRLQTERTRASAEFRTLEDDWREQCRHFASTQNLTHVAEMRIAHIVPDAHDRRGNLLGVVTGAHYRTKAIQQEELLLHVVQEMQKVGGKLYSIVYFHTDVLLSAIPDTTFMQQLHAGLDPQHKRQLQDIYVVHPSAALRAWIFALRLRLPEVYGKVVYVDRLASLSKYVAPEELGELPQHVLEADARREQR